MCIFFTRYFCEIFDNDKANDRIKYAFSCGKREDEENDNNNETVHSAWNGAIVNSLPTKSKLKRNRI